MVSIVTFYFAELHIGIGARMISHKIRRIARETHRSYRMARDRVRVLAPIMKGNTREEKFDAACEAILEKIERQRTVFRNVNFDNLYRDII